nr:C40 family peptidase [Enterococcus sp. 665A]
MTDTMEKLTQLEKEIQERVLQLKDAEQEANFFQLDGWFKTLTSVKEIEAVCKTDDARAKEYTEQVEKITQQQTKLEKKQQEHQAAQKLLEAIIDKQSSSKKQLEQELKENEVLLSRIQEEERQQELAIQNEQETLWEQVVLGQILNTEEEGSEKTQAIILSAKQYLGVPYVWGGTTPNGFDCCGFIQWVFAQNGIGLPRTSQSQQIAAKEVPLAEVQPGDLVFWGRPAHHVGLYIGNDYFIHASQPGDAVKITRISCYPFESAGRIVQ